MFTFGFDSRQVHQVLKEISSMTSPSPGGSQEPPNFSFDDDGYCRTCKEYRRFCRCGQCEDCGDCEGDCDDASEIRNRLAPSGSIPDRSHHPQIRKRKAEYDD